MHEATFRIEGDGTYAAVTAGNDASVELWCNDHCDLLHVSNGATGEILEHVRDQVGVQDLLQQSTEITIITSECIQKTRDDYIEKYLTRHNCLLLPPLRYADGARFCRVLALDPAALTEFYRNLTEDGFRVDVESKHEINSIRHNSPLLTLDSVLPELTSRQRETLVAAHDHGYYEIPRKTTTTEIASEVGVERRTAEEHLRRAENKFIDSMMAHIS
ncbi:helix-turn-helix domain-containing protein [Halococcus sp. AFM35]|uniref:helix-turn-helix domain-containing protein n=1 Tax=Halococcus sp. AFM35 TaxID=3421653 RepID=UPI003EBAD501